MRTGCIYCITNKINGKKYIGQSVVYKRRIRDHINGSQLAVEQAIDKYGEENFKFEKIEKDIPVTEIDEREKHWIDYYDTFKGKGYNLHKGGNIRGTDGFIDVERHGKNNGMYGKKHSKKAKMKIRKKAKERYKEPKNHPMYGTKHSEETKEKMRKNHYDASGINNSQAKGNCKTSLNIIKDWKEKNLTYSELSNKYGFGTSMISDIINCKHWTMRNLIS